MALNDPARMPLLPAQWILHFSVRGIDLGHLLKTHMCVEKWLFSGRTLCVASNRKPNVHWIKVKNKNKITHWL